MVDWISEVYCVCRTGVFIKLLSVIKEQNFVFLLADHQHNLQLGLPPLSSNLSVSGEELPNKTETGTSNSSLSGAGPRARQNLLGW